MTGRTSSLRRGWRDRATVGRRSRRHSGERTPNMVCRQGGPTRGGFWRAGLRRSCRPPILFRCWCTAPPRASQARCPPVRCGCRRGSESPVGPPCRIASIACSATDTIRDSCEGDRTHQRRSFVGRLGQGRQSRFSSTDCSEGCTIRGSRRADDTPRPNSALRWPRTSSTACSGCGTARGSGPDDHTP